MLRGTSLFICDDCKTVFMGLDIEWNCTPLSATQQCIKCGSWHPCQADIWILLTGNFMKSYGYWKMKTVIIMLLVHINLINWKNV